MPWFSRLLASSPGTPEVHNVVTLLAAIALVVYTGIHYNSFDPITFAQSFCWLLGGTGGAAVLVGTQRAIEGDRGTPNENTPKTPPA